MVRRKSKRNPGRTDQKLFRTPCSVVCRPERRAGGSWESMAKECGVSPGRLRAHAKHRLGRKSRTLVQDGDDVRLVAFRMGGDQMMIEPARYVARTLAARGQPVYEFRFSYVAESIRGQFGGVMGAMHASDIPFAFDTVAAKYGKDLTASDAAAARAMNAYWVAFTKTGKPEVSGLPTWRAYDSQGDSIMDFTNNGPVAGSDPSKARLDLAQGVSESKQAGSQGGR